MLRRSGLDVEELGAIRAHVFKKSIAYFLPPVLLFDVTSGDILPFRLLLVSKI